MRVICVTVKSALCFSIWFYFSPKANVPQLKWLEDVKLDITSPQMGIILFYVAEKCVGLSQ